MAHQRVFPGLGFKSHMPFFDGQMLVFCRSDEPVRREFECGGEIWERMRTNRALVRVLPQLQQTLKRQREEATVDDAPLADPVEIETDEAIQKMLASLPTDGTIHGAPQAASANSARAPTAQHTEPPQREPAKPSWRRKAITLAINLAKAANISH